jgi:hypothetical protein
MSNEHKPGVIGSLPRTRPHRRSDKRPAPAGAPVLDSRAQEPALVKGAAPATATPAKKAATKPRAAKAKPATSRPRAAKPKPAAAAPKQAAAAKPKPAAAAPKPAAATPARPPARVPSPGALETAVQAAAELAEIGLHAGARALRRAVSRLPRP